jgi:hypothetical protein
MNPRSQYEPGLIKYAGRLAYRCLLFGKLSFLCLGMLIINVQAFVFVAELEIRQLGTNADVKYKSSLLIMLPNL